MCTTKHWALGSVRTTRAQHCPQWPPRPSGARPAWARCYPPRQPPPTAPTPTRYHLGAAPRPAAASCGKGHTQCTDRAPAAHGRSCALRARANVARICGLRGAHARAGERAVSAHRAAVRARAQAWRRKAAAHARTAHAVGADLRSLAAPSPQRLRRVAVTLERHRGAVQGAPKNFRAVATFLRDTSQTHESATAAMCARARDGRQCRVLGCWVCA